MYARHRHLALLTALLTLVASGPALAWIETTLRSDVVTVDVDPDGQATIQHELVMRIRGGPLKGFELDGVDADAAVLANATVVPVTGATAADTLPLLLERREDGVLRIDVDHARGLRRGTYLFRFGYKTNLAARGLIEADGSSVAIRWVGPRLSDGLDSARTVFRLPTAPEPPRLPNPETEAMNEGGGVFLSTLRRGADKDELEVVRPHVAKGEPVVWRVLASRHAFPAHGAGGDTPRDRPMPTVTTPRERVVFGSVLAGVALLMALLVFFKERSANLAATERSARARALIPLPGFARAALAGAALAGAVAIAWKTAWPTAAGVLLVLAMALGTQLGPREIPALRAPGRWLPLSDADAFRKERGSAPGRWLDAGTLAGLLLFVLLLVGVLAVAAWLFPRSPYHALCAALGSAVLLPVFCTGRQAALPPDRAVAPARPLQNIATRLRENAQLKVVPWARIPSGQSEPDELRLLVMPRRAQLGLTAIEVGMDYHVTGAGVLRLPWVMIRVTEGTEAHQALPRSLRWTRGRKAEERVALLRPALPTAASCLELVGEVAAALTETPARARRQPAIKLTRSAGSGAVAANSASVPSPAHAT